MAAKKRGKNGSGKRAALKAESVPRELPLSAEALRGVAAIFCLAVAGFLVLALIERDGKSMGGPFGSLTAEWLYWLLGVGYLLLPLSLALLGVAIFRSLERKVGIVQLLGMTVFFAASLGLVNLGLPGEGGVLGSWITTPLVHAIASVPTAMFLTAFLLASLIVSFDTDVAGLFASIGGRIRGMRSTGEHAEDDDIDVPVVGMPDTDEEEDEPIHEAEPEDGEDDVPQRSERVPAVKSFASQPSEEAEAGFPVMLATGSEYEPPSVSILGKNKGKPETGDVKANMNIIKRTLQNFGIQVEMDEANIGPTVTRYAMKPAEGVRLSKIVALQSNLELALAASPVRIEAPIPGKSLVGIEVPNIARTTLGLAPLVADKQFANSDKSLLMILGRSITGQPNYADLAKMPHLLVAGATGAGKSVTIHDMIVSLLYRSGPERLRFIMVDPKRVELTLYNPIPHLLTPVITDAKKAILALKWLAKEMDRRYSILETERVRDISSYHKNVVAPALEKAKRTGGAEEKMPEAMPYIVLIIDELADIMQSYPRELEAGIVRLAQMSRAVGIHLILSTQRPSVKVITGLIKANIPARVALQVASQIDSRTILDMGGAEKLLGAGDMLFLSGEMSKPQRLQAPYISEDEVKKVVAWIAKHANGPLESTIDLSDGQGQAGGMDPIFASMADEDEGDELYPQAKQAVIEAGKASTSYLQRKLGIGYARAAKLIDILEERGVVGPADGSKPREIIGAGNADELAREPEEEPADL